LKIALSIAGSDSGAGAGIQADLKTFSALGVYGCTAITAITAQNTRKVAEIFEVSSTMVEQQIRSVMADMPPDAIKVGMVYSRQIIDAVHRSVKRTKVPVVLDPILAAGTGAKLLRDDAFDSFVSKLVPLCTLVTPNRIEAEKLADVRIKTEGDGIDAAKKIRRLGAENVIVKGGHFGTSMVTDILLDSNGRLTKITNPRIKIEESHGSGCNFSSAVTAYLARGAKLEEACRMANEYVHIAIKNAVRVGRGLPVTNPLSAIYRDASRYQVLAELQKGVEQVSTLDGFYRLIPETQTNFVYALPDAADISEVAGVGGRIIRIGNAAVPASYIEFGESRHMASAIIGYMRVNPAFRSVINIRFDGRLVKICKEIFSVSSYDRSKEPSGIKKKEGSSVMWGTMQALSKNPKADVIYHKGDIGKEPMITVFGKNPSEVVVKIKAILKNY
jgi:hydroxymethylpyrimidine kinase/phosphomethylpyrimidine kinase